MFKISFEGSTIDKAVEKLRKYQKLLKRANQEFMIESLEWIKENANENLKSRVGYFAGTLNLKNYWVINEINESTYELRNTNDKGAYVEFGTGIVGLGSHEKADEVNYEYDVNNHGAFGWSWYNSKDNYMVRGFTGYEGKSFLWDAFFEYYSSGEFTRIYERTYRQIIGSIK